MRDDRLVQTLDALLDAEMGEQPARHARVFGADDVGVAQGIERAQRDVAEIADGRRTDVDGSGHAAIIRIGPTDARSSPELRLRL